jgi:hypothetical protein
LRHRLTVEMAYGIHICCIRHANLAFSQLFAICS